MIFSVYENTFDTPLSTKLPELAAIHGHLESKELKPFKDSDISSLYISGADYADALVKGSKSIDKKVHEHLGKKLKKPILEHTESENFLDEYKSFYDSLLAH